MDSRSIAVITSFVDNKGCRVPNPTLYPKGRNSHERDNGARECIGENSCNYQGGVLMPLQRSTANGLQMR